VPPADTVDQAMRPADRVRRILVVDDEPSVRTFVERALHETGYEVVTAPDGPEALGLVLQQPFDLCVVDVMMPRMNGAELGCRLRQINPDIKVLYFTGYSDRLFDQQSALSPNEAFLEKPANGEGVREAVSVMLFGHAERTLAHPQISPVRYTRDAAADRLVHRYYRGFNAREFRNTGTLIASDAALELIPVGQQVRGIDGYLRFATSWAAAFPDATFTVQRVDQRADDMIEVHLLATGTHIGVLDMGVFKFKPTKIRATFHVRELLTIREGRIAASTLSFDMKDIINQLSHVDYSELAVRLQRLRALTDDLLTAAADPERQREIADRIGPELDAARRVLRPHYSGVVPGRAE
jgi:CheY-like chemotaxis protein